MTLKQNNFGRVEIQSKMSTLGTMSSRVNDGRLSYQNVQFFSVMMIFCFNGPRSAHRGLITWSTVRGVVDVGEKRDGKQKRRRRRDMIQESMDGRTMFAR